MTDVTREFVFPGEGMNIDGAIVTADTPMVPGQLNQLPGWPGWHDRKRSPGS